MTTQPPMPMKKRSPRISDKRIRLEALLDAPDAPEDGYSVAELVEQLSLTSRFVVNSVSALLSKQEISLAGKDDKGMQRYKKRNPIASSLSEGAPIRNSNRDTGTPSYWSGYFDRMNTPRLTTGMPRG